MERRSLLGEKFFEGWGSAASSSPEAGQESTKAPKINFGAYYLGASFSRARVGPQP